MSRFVKNSLANLIRGGATAVVSLILPAILKRYFNDDLTFSVWALVLQFAAYISLFNLGIETAVARYVAHYTAQNDAENCQRFCSTAFMILCIAAAVAFFLLGIATYCLPYLYHDTIPPVLMQQMQIALLCVGCALAINLPTSAMSAIFIGLQRNIIPTVIIGSSRLLIVFAIFVVVQFSPTLTAVAITYATINIIASIWQYMAYRTRQTSVKIRWRTATRTAAHELYTYCLSLTIWSVAMIFVNGMDLIILSQFDLKAVGYFSVAASLVAFIAGLQQALFSPLIAKGAEIAAQPHSSQLLGDLLLKSTRYANLILWLTGIPLIIYAKPILNYWMGGDYQQIAAPILIILLFANIVRMLCAPYSFLLVATGAQKTIILTPFLEGLANLSASIFLAWLLKNQHLSALGVAYGTLIGAIIAITIQVIINIPKTTNTIQMSSSIFVNFLWKQNQYFLPFVSMLLFISFILDIQTNLLNIIETLLMLVIAWFILHGDEKKILLHKLFKKRL